MVLNLSKIEPHSKSLRQGKVVVVLDLHIVPGYKGQVETEKLSRRGIHGISNHFCQAEPPPDLVKLLVSPYLTVALFHGAPHP
jgi:hypothetical protein